MSLILNIDTSQETAFVCISENGKPVFTETSGQQQQHAIFLHQSIKKIMDMMSVDMSSLDAVSVAIGPGSYTGLRVGLASAKGICYAAEKPLITIGSLDILAMDTVMNNEPDDEALIGPMIDARRMEVFTGLFEKSLRPFSPPEARILDNLSYVELLRERKIYFTGSGSAKFENLISNPSAVFVQPASLPLSMSMLSSHSFENGIFSSISASEPLYIKDYKAF